MHESLALIAVAAHLAVLARVLAYRKNGARHRHYISWAAWVLVAVIGASVIELALQTRQVGIFEAAQAVLLAAFVYGVRGNVARLLCANECGRGCRER
jgi:Putative 3TM holin, Phage_holin_3